MNSKTQLDPIAAALAEALRPVIREEIERALEEHAAGEPLSPEMLTVEQICAVLQVSRATLHRLRREGLPTVMLGESPRFRKAHCLAWLEARGRRG